MRRDLLQRRVASGHNVCYQFPHLLLRQLNTGSYVLAKEHVNGLAIDGLQPSSFDLPPPSKRDRV